MGLFGGSKTEAGFILTAQNHTDRAFAAAGKALGRLDSDAKRLNRTYASIANAGKLLMGGAAGAGAYRFFRSTVGSADDLADAADRAGLSLESYQSVDSLARSSGLRTDRVLGMFTALEAAQTEALAGNDKLQAAFGRLGVSAADLQNLSLEQLFERVAKGMDTARDRADALAAGHDILGASVEKMRSILATVADGGFDKLNASMKASGQIMDKEMLERLSKANAALEKLDNKVRVFFGGLVGRFFDTGDKVAAPGAIGSVGQQAIRGMPRAMIPQPVLEYTEAAAASDDLLQRMDRQVEMLSKAVGSLGEIASNTRGGSLGP